MKILLAIDDSPCSEAAVRMVMKQFRAGESEVKVLHADEWPKDLPPPVGFARGPGAAAGLMAFHTAQRREAEKLVSAVSKRLEAAAFRSSSEVWEGEAARTILDYAAKWQPDVIVMGSHGRKGLDRLLGSVSDTVLHQAHCAVEIVRP